MRKIVPGGLLSAVLAFAAILALGACGGPERTGQVQAEPIPACEPYRSDPTAFSRCRLFASGLGADLIPEAGRTAGLDAQVRCAPLRTSPAYYQACIEAAAPAAPDPDRPLAGVADAGEPNEAIPTPAIAPAGAQNDTRSPRP